MRPRRVRRRRVMVVVAVLLVVFLVVTARLFIWPPTDGPQRADAVVALGGDPGQLRAKEAVRLVREGYAPLAVVSLGGNPPAPCPDSEPAVPILCFRANPLDTRGEAEYVGALASRRHWHRLIVVPERSQVTRARMLFVRCTTAHLFMVPVTDPISSLPYAVAYEWAATVKALFIRSC